MASETYTETVGRFRVVKHDDLPEGHKAAMRAEGIDPDNHWTLFFSSSSEETARQVCEQENERAPSWATYKVVDHGKAVQIERLIW